jgi:polyhydroxybutyrate depolymerase
MIDRLIRILGATLALAMAFALGSPAAAAPCATNCLAPGDYTIVATAGGLPRSYLVHVPASYTGRTSVPLLLDLHGFSSNAADERQYSGQLQQSDRRGFIAVWPQGVALSWNAYGCCAVADAVRIDDVAFLRSVIAAVQRRANVDDARVFVTGISNGGGMAQRMACEAADVVRAVASVSFPLNTDACRPAKPIGVTEIAGTADKTIAYDGSSTPPLPNDVAGVPLGVQGARASLAAWKRLDGCTDELTRTPLPADSRAEEYRGCTGGVKVGLVTIADGPHVLYSGYVGLGYTGAYTAPIDISGYIWDHVFDL